jgi:hypothetical protein
MRCCARGVCTASSSRAINVKFPAGSVLVRTPEEDSRVSGACAASLNCDCVGGIRRSTRCVSDGLSSRRCVCAAVLSGLGVRAGSLYLGEYAGMCCAGDVVIGVLLPAAACACALDAWLECIIIMRSDEPWNGVMGVMGLGSDETMGA